MALTHSPRFIVGRLVLAGIAVVGLCSALVAAPLGAQPRPVEIVAATPVDELFTRAIDDFSGRLRGAAVVRTVPPGEAAKTVDAVRRGDVPVSIVPLGALNDVSPRFGVFSLPFTFPDAQSFQNFTRGQGRDILVRDLRARGMGALGVWYGGALVVASRTPIRTPKDFAGKKLAVRSAPTAREFSAVGASPVRIAPGEVAAAIRQGAVDGAELPWTEIARLDLDRIYVAPTNHRFNGYVTIFNEARWAALPPSTRTRVQDAVEDVGRELSSQVLRREQDAERQALRSGRAIELAVPEATRRQWHGSLAQVQRNDIARIGPELVDEARMRISFRASANGGPGVSYLWNAWFESDPANVVNVLDERRYRFTLDLGRGPYPGTLHGVVGRLVGDAIARLPDTAEIRLLIRPVLLGDVLKAAEGTQLTAKTLVLKRDRLGPHPRADELRAQLAAKAISLDQYAAELSLAGEPVSWDLSAQGTGCGTVALSIWNDTGRRPLDYVIVRVPVKPGGGDVPRCSPGVEGGELSAGLQGMLDIELEGSASRRHADAALHLFDTGRTDDESTSTVAVYIERDAYLAAEREGRTPDLAAWVLPAPFSRFLTGAVNLPNSVTRAHNAIRTPQPYAQVVRQMNNALFGAGRADDRQAAEQARASLQRLADRDPPPIVLVRYVGFGGQVHFVPLSMLAANAPERVLSRRVTVVQQMTSIKASAPNACFGQWDFAIPRKLDGVDGDDEELLKDAAWRFTGDRVAWVEDNRALLDYFASREAPRTGSALVLLAHHGDGMITYSSSASPDGILEADRKREFPDGSVAVLAACATTGASLDNKVFVTNLSKLGVRAFVASPFQVDTKFGTRLATNFVAVAKEARASTGSETTRLLDLFDRAIARTIESFPDPGYRDMALEFQIIGDHAMPVCKPAPPT